MAATQAGPDAEAQRWGSPLGQANRRRWLLPFLCGASAPLLVAGGIITAHRASTAPPAASSASAPGPAELDRLERRVMVQHDCSYADWRVLRNLAGLPGMRARALGVMTGLTRSRWRTQALATAWRVLDTAGPPYDGERAAALSVLYNLRAANWQREVVRSARAAHSDAARAAQLILAEDAWRRVGNSGAPPASWSAIWLLEHPAR